MPDKQKRETPKTVPAAGGNADEPKGRQLPVWLGPVIIVAILAIFWLPQLLSNAAAVVNGESISKAELERRVAFERLWGEWSGNPAPTSGREAAQFRSSVLDQMIENRLVVQAARKAGVTTSSKDVADKIASVRNQWNLTDAQMNDSLTRAGMSRQTLETVMQEDALVERYLRAVVMAGATDAEQQTAVRNWYNDAYQKAKIEKHIESGGVKLNEPAPDFMLNDLDGKPVRLSDLKGKAVLINFFASWCNPCRAETPDLEATWKANKDRGLVILAVNLTSQDKLSDVQKYVKEFGLTFPIVLDERGSVASLYRVVPIPTSFFINRSGVVVAVEVTSMSRQKMEQRVAKLLQ